MKYFKISLKDEKEYYDYQKIRGETLYEFVAKYCCYSLKKAKVDYKLVRELIKYDKRIKDNLYKFLGTLEDYLKSQIYSNTFFENEFQLKLESSNYNEKKYFSAFYEINKGKYFFGDLIKIAKTNKLIDSSIDWDKIRDFRNKIMHFNFLLFGETKEGKQFNLINLKEDILLLRKVLPGNYGDSLIKNINKTKKGIEKDILNKYSIFFMEEIK